MNRVKRTYLLLLQILLLGVLLVVPVGKPLFTKERVLIASLNSHYSEESLQVIEGFEKQVAKMFPQAEHVRYTLQESAAENEQIVREINKDKPVLLLTVGSKATHVGLREIPAVPLVATMILNEQVLAQSSRATGVLLAYPPKIQMQYLRRFLPGRNQVGMLYDPEENSRLVEQMKQTAEKAGVEIEAIAVSSIKELPAALKSLGRRVDILLGTPDKTVYSGKTAKAVLLSSFRNRIPFVGLSSSWVKAGALYALTWDYKDLGRQCGVLAERILSGTSVSDIAPVTPEKVCYELNLRTAEHLRLSIAPALIQGATEVYR